MGRSRIAVLVASVFLIGASGLFAGGATESKAAPVTLRIASPSEGPDQIKIYDAMMKEFENAHPGVTVTWDRSSGDDYQFQGLPSLLESSTPPDVYFEWGGNRVRNHALDGEALDISDVANQLKGGIVEAAWSGSVFDGKTYMIPTSQDITIMMWYNKDIFSKLGLSVPKTVDEFVNVCSKLKAAGITPILMGNSDAWVAGNFVGNFLSRVAGEEAANDVLSLKPGTKFDNPDFEEAMQFAYDLGEMGFINKDLNTLGYEASFARLFDNSSAMYPLGTWFKTEVISGFAPDPSKANFDFFPLPSFPGGKGDQSSYMGLNVGFVVNAKTQHPDLAKEFVKLMADAGYNKQFAANGAFPAVKGTIDTSDAYAQRVEQMIRETRTVVAPPDTGYNLEMAGALYQAMAKVLVNEMTPKEALAEVDQKVAHLR